jgi:HSP20 family protein
MASVETARRPSELETREKQAVEREQTRPGPVFRPDVDIVERANEFLVMADLPGVDDQSVSVRLENGVLSIDARLALEPDPGWTAVYAEYRLGGYHREFALSEGIDVDRVEARMRNGVLELRLPKVERARPRSIEVKT